MKGGHGVLIGPPSHFGLWPLARVPSTVLAWSDRDLRRVSQAHGRCHDLASREDQVGWERAVPSTNPRVVGLRILRRRAGIAYFATTPRCSTQNAEGMRPMETQLEWTITTRGEPPCNGRPGQQRSQGAGASGEHQVRTWSAQPLSARAGLLVQ
jgi:hypothetical protein